MYTIAKRFAFSASHIIGGLPADHPCARLHGHNYEVEVILRSPILDAVGFVRDYHELLTLRDFINRMLDHRHLNTFSATIEPLPESSAGGSSIGARRVGRKWSPCA
jgi:6-pyruvoyl-tetrahydropterin synthase